MDHLYHYHFGVLCPFYSDHSNIATILKTLTRKARYFSRYYCLVPISIHFPTCYPFPVYTMDASMVDHFHSQVVVTMLFRQQGPIKTQLRMSHLLYIWVSFFNVSIIEQECLKYMESFISTKTYLLDMCCETL